MTASEHQMYERVAALEARVEHQLAAKEWVRETIQPVIEATARTEKSVEKLASSVTELTQDTKALYASHDKLLQERSERERIEHEQRLKSARDNTLLNVIKERWAPIGAFVALLLGLVTTMAAVASWWINHYVQAAR